MPEEARPTTRLMHHRSTPPVSCPLPGKQTMSWHLGQSLRSCALHGQQTTCYLLRCFPAAAACGLEAVELLDHAQAPLPVLRALLLDVQQMTGPELQSSQGIAEKLPSAGVSQGEAAWRASCSAAAPPLL